MQQSFDVLIAGAGPAGSHAGALLAGQGLRVALLDRAHFPRDKVCGGGLSAKSLRLLGDLPAELIQRRFTGAYITWRNEAAIVKDLDREAGCTVLRSAFDAWLVARAQRAGASFYPGTQALGVSLEPPGVRLDTSRGTFHAAFLLVADGVGSTLRTQLFGRNAIAYAPAVEALIPVDETALERLGQRVVFDLGGMPNGYGWIFPKRDHLNVGVYSPFGGRGIRAHLDTFLARHGLTRRSAPTCTSGYAIPVANRIGKYEHGPVLLLGDAAGFAEAVWGEGIYFALLSAVLAARAFERGRGKAPTGAYSDLVRAVLEPELRSSRRLARLLYAAGRFAFDPLARSRLGCDWFAAVISGELSYRACFWRSVLGAPAWLAASRHALERPIDFGPLEGERGSEGVSIR
ncbi:MAG TPA: geranylgeranyl reductase family protein [Burkholderiales bacterium]|nr:geranylgeranyl reductase family protein [Burkholderiales bacterium]